MIIAIDGPSGAGKGTLAQKLATHFNMAYLDTGLLFRALAYKAQQCQALDDISYMRELALNLQACDWQQPTLRSSEVAEAASVIAIQKPVREALQAFMRAFAHEHNQQGAILDGRDIGTVVCPWAPIKLYITASSAQRAQRRFLELQSGGFTGTLGEVLSNIERRDKRDQDRAQDPLKPALDAFVIDTTHLNQEEVYNIALNYILKSSSALKA